MDRRDFLKLSALTGMAVVAPLPFVKGAARAADDIGPGKAPFFIAVHAGGGWDPTSLCDPKGRKNEEELDPMNSYMFDDIMTSGNISYPTAYRTPGGDFIAETGNQAFFEKFYNQLLVINGVDTATNGHGSGTRHIWSGNLADDGRPAFAALVAAVHGDGMPMAFITNGGYDMTGGLVAKARVGNGLNNLLKLADTNVIAPGQEATYHSMGTWEKIQAHREQRLSQLTDTARLPLVQEAMSHLYVTRSSSTALDKLKDALPELQQSNNPLVRQAQLAIAAYKAGIAQSANLTVGGFDTHGDHDNRQFNALRRYTEGVAFLMEEAERQGVADDIIVAMGSDFGRTPGYNMNMGKDHWSITSMMFMGKGIPGNKVIGETTHGHVAKTLNPDTLELDENGTRIRPAHIHNALRKLVGVHGHEFEQLFPLDAEPMDLFNTEK